ncbi:hypothetical protein L6452_31239 [Arctium lappa]|uniref:Uncharacterized protein n=1 Tax=Arctium lappa TaxID=4217 RepID=A0ACB8ZKQ2_ARCLA|nr:hypothetical protein L6452_31239 [Arctium lappa]
MTTVAISSKSYGLIHVPDPLPLTRNRKSLPPFPLPQNFLCCTATLFLSPSLSLKFSLTSSETKRDLGFKHPLSAVQLVGQPQLKALSTGLQRLKCYMTTH